MHLPQDVIRKAIDTALEEDLGERGDITSQAVVPSTLAGQARILAKGPGVLAGVDVARAVFRRLDPDCEFPEGRRDGDVFAEGDVLLGIRGLARALLAAERTALNFLQRMCGIAWRTRQFVEAMRGTGSVVLETRKTTPGLRFFEKYAVRVGGGQNHRFGLFDRVLLKSNHFALSGNGVDGAGYGKTVEQAVAAAGGSGPITAEARSLAEAEAVFRGGADILLLDNFEPGLLADVVARIRELARREGRDVLIEASGGIRLDNVARFAATGVDRISVGALTHSVPAIDLNMRVEGA
jgi:nicotinate-nucleotide pyrophosphorylase (carboxylating)